MKVNKIFDLTENDSPEVQTQIERETNQQLEYDETDNNGDLNIPTDSDNTNGKGKN